MNLLLKFSDLYDDEQFSDGTVLDFRSLEGTNSFCSEESAEAIAGELSGYPLNGVHWIDSGDYHYLTALFLRSVREPFILALFDNHSDDGESAFCESALSCGNWVAWLERNNPHMRSHCLNTVPEDSSVPVYLSLDLDILSTDFVKTNWNQGTMTLEELENYVLECSEGRRVLGADICGGLTLARGASPRDLALNLRTRERLKVFFRRIFPYSEV
ncbi:MAG: hypothetical protein MJY61_02655 [Bacteroidales bacterium]|nr:hypothetical protein [Bacteroidales bacterium]